MDRITRSKLKTDPFAQEVGHTVEFFTEHRKQVLRYGGIAAALILIAGGLWYYRDQQRAQRQRDLAEAMQKQEAPYGPVPAGAPLSYPTQDAKTADVVKSFKAILDRYPGTTEATIAASYLGAISSDQGKLSEAEKYFQQASSSSDKNYASVAKLSLAQLYFATGRAKQGESMLRDLMNHPTILVSKEQATIVLAKAIAQSNPAEARKLLEPLRMASSGVSQTAVTALAQLPPQ